MEAQDQKRFEAFELAFRDLFVRDLRAADAGDVRMGTFILCAAFLDALALCYSAGMKIRGGLAGKWRRFVHDYLGPRYEPLWDSYGDFRSLLLHNYSVKGLAFTHGPGQAGLHLVESGGRVILHRETFVHDVIEAFERFATDVREDGDLRGRLFDHFDRFPPMGLLMIDWKDP